MEIEVDTEAEVNFEYIKKEKSEPENRSEPSVVRKYKVNVLVSCQICEYRTQHRMNLERHYVTHFGEEMNTICEQVSRDLKCSLCIHESKTKVNMKMHLALKHKYLNKVLQAKGYEAFTRKIMKGRERKDKEIKEPIASTKKQGDPKSKLVSFMN